VKGKNKSKRLCLFLIYFGKASSASSSKEDKKASRCGGKSKSRGRQGVRKTTQAGPALDLDNAGPA